MRSIRACRLRPLVDATLAALILLMIPAAGYGQPATSPLRSLTTQTWFRVAIISVVFGVVWLLLAAALEAFKRVLLVRHPDEEDDKRIVTLMRVARRILGALTVVVFIIQVLSELGVSIAPLLGTAGVAGVALGLAAQGIARDILAGFFLLFDNQLRVGDEVEIAGKHGVVEALSIRCIRLRGWDGNVHFVRTGQIDTVTNLSLEFAYVVVDVPVAHNSDIHMVFGAIREAVAALRQDPAIGSDLLEEVDIAGIDRVDDTAVVVRARLKVRPRTRIGVRLALLERIVEQLSAAGVQGPLRRIEMHDGRGPASHGVG